MIQRQRILRSTIVWLAPLAAALIVRLVLWNHIPRTGLISDEGEYIAAAHWLADGRGFDWYQGYLWTRAPLYPLFVAAHIWVFGADVAPLYISQIILSLASIGFVFLIAKQITADRPLFTGIATLVSGLYLPFALYTQVVLSETLFITLILAALLILSQERFTARHAGLSGILLGLATLTRSLTLGFLPIVLIWMMRRQYPRDRTASQPLARGSAWMLPNLLQVPMLCFLLALALTILPWTIYNSRMYGGTVLIDTSGAFNLFLGARTAFDGKRSDAQVRDYALGMLGQPTSAQVRDTCKPFPGILPSQAARQAMMTSEAICLITSRPLAFVQKSLSELIDLFQINYTGAERFTNGFSTGRLSPAYLLALFLLDDTLYVVILPLAVVGWALARVRTNQPIVVLTGLWWAYNVAVAPLLFAINRFRLPLMPLACVFAMWALSEIWRAVSSRGHRLAGTAPQASEPIASRIWQPTLFVALATTLATLLFLIAATPYAYLEPLVAGQDSRWASYFGRYPSSLAITQIALDARVRYQSDQRLADALHQGDLEQAQQILDGELLGIDMMRLGPAILVARSGNAHAALALLPSPERMAQSRDSLAAILRGDLLRTLGDESGALATFSARYVDDSNPVAWAWEWLRPAPTTRINLGGSLDLGYIQGCYLGEGEPSSIPPANFRWCSDGAQLRFPRAASGAPQTLVLRADGRAWGSYAAAPTIHVQIAGREIGQFTLITNNIEQYQVALPPAPPGSDIVVTIRSPVFVPDAARYNSQQSEAVVGQVQFLGLRLDWAEVR